MHPATLTQAKLHLRKADPVMARLIDLHDPYASARDQARRIQYNNSRSTWRNALRMLWK